MGNTLSNYLQKWLNHLVSYITSKTFIFINLYILHVVYVLVNYIEPCRIIMYHVKLWSVWDMIFWVWATVCSTPCLAITSPNQGVFIYKNTHWLEDCKTRCHQHLKRCIVKLEMIWRQKFVKAEWKARNAKAYLNMSML